MTSTKLKVTGIDLFSAGDFTGGADTEEIVLHDAVGGVYKKLVLRDNRIVGGVLYGDTVDGAWYFQLLRDKQDIHEIRDHLMFGQSHLGNSGHQGQSKAAAMSDDMEVCGCNGVCKGTIVKAIKEKGLFTLDDVRKHTKASSSCGSCTGLVEQILASTVGGAYQPAQTKNKPVCGCTEHTHEEVRRVIREQHLLSIPAVMKFMEWRTPNGCATCRPALNYYLLSTWPHEAQDDPQSRFINERAHANIQKDGTYSVVPRMWGGTTSAAELRRIADVVDKYKIPTVKVTGGQRIDLLGVKKEDLPGVWRDLDMPSGHAYAKALRTVKTCVGSEWCRFGVQDSTNMGIDLEKDLWRMYAPHKVKLAVSGCPRNCAESTIKDVGVIGVDSGWEIYVAGNGGIKTEVAQFLCKVKTREEVLEYAGAFLQLYREEGRYLDRTVHYVHASASTTSSSASSRTPKTARRFMRACALRCRASPTRGGSARRARMRANSRCWRRDADEPIGAQSVADEPGRCARRCGRAWRSQRERLAKSVRAGCDSAARRARGEERARQHRGVSQRRGRSVCAARQMPAQRRPVVAGHRVRPQGRLSAARLEHRSR